jgi:quinol monooxygenase YgiN
LGRIKYGSTVQGTGGNMAVLITAEVKGQTQQGYDGMLNVLAEPVRKAPGFVMHAAHPVEGGWRVIEVWESEDDANNFFAKAVAPNLPPGIRPKRSVQELHSLVTP